MTDNSQGNIGVHIMSARRASGVSQLDLANRVGVSVSTVSNWERGVSDAPISKVIAIADTLGVSSIDRLVGR